MNSNLFNAIGLGALDPGILFLVLILLVIVLLVLVIIQGNRFKKLAKKYNMHVKLVYNIEMAMFNDKCCLIFGIDRRDGVIIRMTFLDDGRRVEYEVDQYFISKFDDSDREGIDFNWDHMSQKIRNELILISRGLDSKWSSVLQGDMSWFEGFKRSGWCHEQHFYIEERNKILDEIIAWQQGQ